MALDTRAYHHDESIHAKMAWDLMNGVAYRYDPVYHGPFQYFATAAVFKLFHAGDFTGRILPAIFGSGIVFLLPWLYRIHLGRYGTWIAMVALTLSTGFMYFSRFARNDIYIAFWTVFLFGVLLRYIDNPQRRWVLLAGTSLGFAFITKENAYITGFIFVSFVLLLGIWVWQTCPVEGPSGATRLALVRAFRSLWKDPEGFGYSLAIFLGIVFLFMTSFFTNIPGFREGIIKSFTVWLDIHGSERVNQPWFFYLIFAFVYEIFAVVMGLLAIGHTIRRPKLLPMLLVYWTVTSFFIYSVAGEKAAWLTLHSTLPLTLLASWFVGDRVSRVTAGGLRLALIVVTVVLLAWTARNAVPVSFVHGDVPYDFVIYTQTSRDVLDSLETIEEAGRRTGQGFALPVFLHPETHWPYAWYLRDYTAIQYASAMTEPPIQKIILASDGGAREFGYLMFDYVGIEMKLREWFPEHVYRDWDWNSVRNFPFGDNFSKLARFYFLREPPDSLGASNFVMYVHKELLMAGPLGRFDADGFLE